MAVPVVNPPDLAAFEVAYQNVANEAQVLASRLKCLSKF